jgi:hypothetical protein
VGEPLGERPWNTLIVRIAIVFRRSFKGILCWVTWVLVFHERPYIELIEFTIVSPQTRPIIIGKIIIPYCRVILRGHCSTFISSEPLIRILPIPKIGCVVLRKAVGPKVRIWITNLETLLTEVNRYRSITFFLYV